MLTNKRVNDLDFDQRFTEILTASMNVYVNRLINKYYEEGLEKNFQFYFSLILKSMLDISFVNPNEQYQISLEEKIVLYGQYKDYVDIVIKYSNGVDTKKYCIELKFITASHAPDNVQIEIYKDISDLEFLKNNQCSCYLIFLTNQSSYAKKNYKGTRAEIPIYDMYQIEGSKKYFISSKSAREHAGKRFADGFAFKYNHEFLYNKLSEKDREYYWVIMKI